MNTYAVWHNNKVIAYCTMTQEDADELNHISGSVLYFGIERHFNPEKCEKENRKK